MPRDDEVAVAGASGYAGGEILRLLLGHPAYADGRLTIGALTAAASAGTPLGRAPSAPAAAGPAGARAHRRRRAAPATTWCSWPCRTGTPRRWPSSSAPTPWSSTAAPTSGSPTPRRGSSSTARRTPAAGRTGCPSCPAHASALRGAKRIAVPGLLSDRGAAGAVARDRRGPRRARGHRRRRQRHLRCRPRREDRPARLGGHRIGAGLQHRRRAPAHPRDRPGPAAPSPTRDVTVSFTPVLIPTSRGILATCTARTTAPLSQLRAAYEKAYDAEPFVHLLPEGQLPQHRRGDRQQRRAARGRRRRGRRDVRRDRRHRQPRQGHRRRGRAVDEPGPGLAGDGRTFDRGSGAVTRTAADESPAACAPRASPRRRASAPPESRPASRHPARSTWRWCSTRAPTTRPPACSPATRSRPRRCCGRQQVLTTGRLRAVILNSGGANACTGPRRFPGHPRHRRGRRRRAVGLGHRDRGHRGRGLLDRADRRPAADGQGAGRRHRDRARDGRRPDRRRGGRPRHHDHRHRAETGCAAPQ